MCTYAHAAGQGEWFANLAKLMQWRGEGLLSAEEFEVAKERMGSLSVSARAGDPIPVYPIWEVWISHRQRVSNPKSNRLTS